MDFARLTLTDIDFLKRCAKRELNKRKWFYPKWVTKGKMSQDEADFELKGMQAVADYFDWLYIHTSPEQQRLF